MVESSRRYPVNLSRPAGVVTGDDVRKLFEYARKNKFAIPAINVTSSSTAVAALEAAQNLSSPIILQISSGGAEFWAGKGVKRGEGKPLDDDHEARIQGSIAAAHYIRSIAPYYNIPVILHTDHCHEEHLPWLDGLLDANDKHNQEFHENVKALKEPYEKLLGTYEGAAIRGELTGEDQKSYDALKAKYKVLFKDYSEDRKEPLFSSHMIDLSKLTNEKNIAATRERLVRSKEVGTWLEMEIGITGGEEDGVNNEKADRKKLYTNPEEIWEVYQTLSEVSPNFSIAAAFGNVHGVYKVGAVKLRPWLLGKHQKYVKAKIANPTAEDIPGAVVPDEPDDMEPDNVDANENPETKNPVFFVFHGGSGSAKEEFLTGIEHGIVKVNIDTDTQFAYCRPVRDWMVNDADRLEVPVGTKKDPNGNPNKDLFDPRKWLRKAEQGMTARVQTALQDFNAAGKWIIS